MRKHFVLLLLLVTGLFAVSGHARDSLVESTTPRAVTLADWQVVIDDPEEASSGQWKIRAHGTNTSGGRLYDSTATLSLSGAGEIFPQAIQNMGDVADQETVDAEWTVNTGGDLPGFNVLFQGCPDPVPCKRR